MFRKFLNSVLLISFLSIFCIDSMTSFFELDNTIFCELTDITDGEDSNEEELNKMESEAVLMSFPNIEPQMQILASRTNTDQFLIVNLHTLSIPTPPPEYNF